MTSVSNIIEIIKDCVNNNKQLPSTLKGYTPNIHEAKILVDELNDIAYKITENALYLDNKGNDCWEFYLKALELTDTKIEFPNTSTIVFEGRKRRSEWKEYALMNLEMMHKLIKDFEYDSHSLFLLPYTSKNYKNIKLLHAKDILIFFTLIKRKYPNIVLTNYTCFRFDDIDISMSCLKYIQKIHAHAYDYLMPLLPSSKH